MASEVEADCAHRASRLYRASKEGRRFKQAALILRLTWKPSSRSSRSVQNRQHHMKHKAEMEGKPSLMTRSKQRKPNANTQVISDQLSAISSEAVAKAHTRLS